MTIGGKSLKEHPEASNHARAIDFVSQLVGRHRVVSERDVLRLHELVLEGVDHAAAGSYRTVAVRITGSTVALPNPRRVPDRMRDFSDWLQSGSALHPVHVAAEAHDRLVSIHPFIDGNGRTAGMLLKIGQMAKVVGESVPTIRHWMKLGLLHPAARRGRPRRWWRRCLTKKSRTLPV
jgi:Fic family protein